MVLETLTKPQTINTKRLSLPVPEVGGKRYPFHLSDHDFDLIQMELHGDRSVCTLFAEAKILYDQQKRIFPEQTVPLDELLKTLEKETSDKRYYGILGELYTLCILNPEKARPYRQNEMIASHVENWLKFETSNITPTFFRKAAKTKIIYPALQAKELFVTSALISDARHWLRKYENENNFLGYSLLLSRMRIVDQDLANETCISQRTWEKANNFLNVLRTQGVIDGFLSTASALSILAAPGIAVTDKGILFPQSTVTLQKQPLPVERNF